MALVISSLPMIRVGEVLVVIAVRVSGAGDSLEAVEEPLLEPRVRRQRSVRRGELFRI
jgi:hypothetical protein